MNKIFKILIMKKILIALSIGLCGVITSCDWFGTGGDPDIIPSPEFVRAEAVPASVEYNGSTTFQWEVKYAKSVSINGVAYGPKGSIELKNLISDKTVEIVAYGGGPLFSSRIVVIPVDPAPIILNAGDSIAGSWIRAALYLTTDNGLNWYEEKLEEKYINEKYVFSTTSVNSNKGNLICYLYPYSSSDKLGDDPWSISGRTLIVRDQIYNFTLNKDESTNKIVLTTFITKDGVRIDEKTGKEITFPVIHKTIFIKQ